MIGRDFMINCCVQPATIFIHSKCLWRTCACLPISCYFRTIPPDLDIKLILLVL
jgi:hypothetical protein